MFNNIFVVVVYNKFISESKTLKNILSSRVDFCKSKLIIWNNGPNGIFLVESEINKSTFKSVELVETLNNSSLSMIYNNVISNNESHKYIFLDDDSDLSEQYLEHLSYVATDQVAVPIISSSKVIVSPQIDNHSLSANSVISDYKAAMGIASGLVVGSCVVTAMKKQYGCVFDERFYLYGVDTSFFKRLIELKDKPSIYILNGFEHSLSRLESDGYTPFKVKERSYDLGLQLRYYFPFYHSFYKCFIFSCKDVLKLILRKKRTYNFIYLCHAYLGGKHYKNIN
ncbi:hypothetical protein [Shewanella sp. UCD-KL21]|uniref:hypothetical protein n=1 Tax=Shewanella sp. UCD-KL21 TaxID=1917164 RepID=UPI00097145C9|nr:hypothetical protein [Shewanella sp. UCD-KL21]